ncbi:MAG: phosphoesterase [Candidatus Aenigmarchaeota archaeon]|nr:phosphoesterase [Candidatus Aenigmarchaeota archaeon]
MEIKFLTEPALLLENNILVISDLHIGIEYEIFKSGITIPSQVEKLEKRINNLIKQTKAKHLVILGDVKHQVPNISWQEYREIPKFLEHFQNIKISIIKGNHDGNIERLAPPEIDIYDAQGFKINNFLLTHGQAWPFLGDLNAEYIIMGHVHPAVEFWTENFRSIEPCWLKCEINNEKLFEKYKIKTEIKHGIIIPAFNHLIGGMAFNSKDFEPLGPLLKNEVFEWKKAEVYLLDGTLLGNLKNLKVK